MWKGGRELRRRQLNEGDQEKKSLDGSKEEKGHP